MDHEKDELQEQFMQVFNELTGLKQLIKHSEIVLKAEMETLAAKLNEWKACVDATQLVYSNLNKMTFQASTSRIFSCAWCLKEDKGSILAFLQNKVI